MFSKRSNKSSDARHNQLSRREFARAATLAAAGIAVLPRDLGAAVDDPEKKATVPPPSSEKQLSAADQAEVEARIQAIFRKYGPRFSADQKAEIRRLVRESQAPLAAFRAFPLSNEDEPATILRPVLERDQEKDPMEKGRADAE